MFLQGTSNSTKPKNAGGRPRGAHIAEDGDGDYGNGDDDDDDVDAAGDGANDLKSTGSVEPSKHSIARFMKGLFINPKI